MIKLFLSILRQQGLTQEEIAHKTGLSQTLVSKLMRGGACNVDTLLKIADAFDVSTDTVLGRDKKKPDQGDNSHVNNKRRKYDWLTLKK